MRHQLCYASLPLLLLLLRAVIAAGLAPVIASVIQTSPIAAAAVSSVTTTQCPAGSICIGGDITTSAGIPADCATTGLTSAAGSDSADDCNSK
jgi:hypothetical protein